jgi:hypothetical protein
MTHWTWLAVTAVVASASACGEMAHPTETQRTEEGLGTQSTAVHAGCALEYAGELTTGHIARASFTATRGEVGWAQGTAILPVSVHLAYKPQQTSGPKMEAHVRLHKTLFSDLNDTQDKGFEDQIVFMTLQSNGSYQGHLEMKLRGRPGEQEVLDYFQIAYKDGRGEWDSNLGRNWRFRVGVGVSPNVFGFRSVEP